MISTELQELVSKAKANFDSISPERRENLSKLADFVRTEKKSGKVNLIFICIHNSRRSHLSQVWSQVAAHEYGHDSVVTYSGGTEVTALYPAVAKALTEQGLAVKTIGQTANPVYSIKYDVNSAPLIGFSKIYDDPFNPQSGFGAIMVCSAADSNCPYISTAAERILISFEDPKAFDGTDEQMDRYKERSFQIATEFMYAFSLV